MESAVYHERGFSTVDMKFAVLCLIFGGKLRQHLPLEWNDIYPSLDAYLENLQDPRRSPPQTRISFNFELVSLPDEILSAWRIQGGDLISSLMANGARTAILAAHEHLRELIVLWRDKRPDAKWETIKGDRAGESVTLGKRSSPELQAEFLGKL